MKKPSTVKASVTTPKAQKPRKRPKMLGLVWYNIVAKGWYAGWFHSDQSEKDFMLDKLMRGDYDADPTSVRIVTIEGE